eukprot:jgi/Mesvir1/16368/Mv25726-RA.1
MCFCGLNPNTRWTSRPGPPSFALWRLSLRGWPSSKVRMVVRPLTMWETCLLAPCPTWHGASSRTPLGASAMRSVKFVTGSTSLRSCCCVITATAAGIFTAFNPLCLRSDLRVPGFALCALLRGSPPMRFKQLLPLCCSLPSKGLGSEGGEKSGQH